MTGCIDQQGIDETHTQTLLAPLPADGILCLIPGGTWTSPITVNYQVDANPQTGSFLFAGDAVLPDESLLVFTSNLIIPATDATLSGSPGNNSVGDVVNYQFTETGGTDCQVTAGNLPPNLSLDPSSCVLSGTIDPSAAGQTYIYTVSNDASDGQGNGAHVDVTQTINPAAAPVDATLTVGSLTGTAGTPISIPVNHANGVNCTATGLPTGLTVDPVTCAITGTTTQTGTFPITFTYPAADGIGKTATATTTLTIASAAAPVDATVTGSATPGTVGTPGTWPFTATNGTTCSITAGALPPGLTLDPATCAVSGTPTTAGNYSYTLTDPAADGIGATGTDPVTQTINPAAAPVDATLTVGSLTGTAGTPISIPVNHANGVNCTATGLPTGLTVDPVTCAITGTTTQTGAFPITFTYPAADGIGKTAAATTTLTIASAVLPSPVINPIVGAGTLLGLTAAGLGIGYRRRRRTN